MLEADRLPFVLLGCATVIVGILLLVSDIRRTSHRAFGTIVILRGITFVIAGVVAISSHTMTGALLRFQPYLMLPLIPLSLYFVSVFPERRGPLSFRGSGWVAFAVATMLALLYAVNHDLVFTLSPSGAVGFENAGPGWSFASFGPLSILLAAVHPVLATLGLVYAWEYAKDPSARQLHGVVAAGFILNGIFDGGLAAAALLNDPSVFSLTGYALAFPFLRALALIPAAVALGMVMTTQREESNRIRWVLPGLAVLALISGPIPIILGISGYGLTWHSLIILSLWRLVMPVTVGYALIRSGMLDQVRLPNLWPRGSRAAARPVPSARSTED